MKFIVFITDLVYIVYTAYVVGSHLAEKSTSQLKRGANNSVFTFHTDRKEPKFWRRYFTYHKFDFPRQLFLNLETFITLLFIIFIYIIILYIIIYIILYSELGTSLL